MKLKSDSKYIMKAAVGLFVAVLLPAVCNSCLAEDEFEPLDTRTRCIVMFRECLVHIANKDIDEIFMNIADGGEERGFTFNPERKRLAGQMKIGNRDRFINHNFPHASFMYDRFNEILFAKLTTANEPVELTSETRRSKHEGRYHTIRIKVPVIPGEPKVDPQKFTELRFVEEGGHIYWVPFGW